MFHIPKKNQNLSLLIIMYENHMRKFEMTIVQIDKKGSQT